MASAMISRPSSRLPQIKTGGIYEGKFRDSTPHLSAAGKLTATSDTAEMCLKPPEKRCESPEVVRKFRASLQPGAGKMRVFYGKAYDPHMQIAKNMTHGAMVQPSFLASELVNPPPKTLFSQRTVDKRESIYASHIKTPLGKSHDQAVGLPRGLNPDIVTFGVKTIKDGTAGELVNPDKTHLQVMAESEEGRDLYRRSHCEMMPSERHTRSYNKHFSENDVFGTPTPHENDGRHTRKNLKWLHDELTEKRAPIVTRRVDAFRERTQPQLGKVHDPIKDTLNVPPDHTFGILIKPDEFGADDLIHNRPHGNYLRGKDRHRGLIAALRRHLQKANYLHFPDLLAAFKHYDQNKDGLINKEDIRAACQRFNLPVNDELLEALMKACGVDPQSEQVDYATFVDYLNFREDKIPGSVDRKVQSAPEKCQSRQIDRAVGQHRTSSGMINAIVGGVTPKDYRCYGVPTIRTDLAAPRIKRINDKKNYGDESTVYGLINQSIFSNHGVYEQHFLMPRPREEIREVFANIGFNTDLDTFDRLYEVAQSRNPRGEVSIESFRNVLDEAQTLHCAAKI